MQASTIQPELFQPQFPPIIENVVAVPAAPKIRQPIVAISSKEIAEIPPDAFDFTPMSITIVPELMTTLITTTTVEPVVQTESVIVSVTNNEFSQQQLKNLQQQQPVNNNIQEIAIPEPSIIQPEIIRPSIIKTATMTTTTTFVPIVNSLSNQKSEKPVVEFGHDDSIDTNASNNADRVIQINLESSTDQTISSKVKTILICKKKCLF